jgi:hypothetical protein
MSPAERLKAAHASAKAFADDDAGRSAAEPGSSDALLILAAAQRLALTGRAALARQALADAGAFVDRIAPTIRAAGRVQ